MCPLEHGLSGRETGSYGDQPQGPAHYSIGLPVRQLRSPLPEPDCELEAGSRDLKQELRVEAWGEPRKIPGGQFSKGRWVCILVFLGVRGCWPGIFLLHQEWGLTCKSGDGQEFGNTVAS